MTSKERVMKAVPDARAVWKTNKRGFCMVSIFSHEEFRRLHPRWRSLESDAWDDAFLEQVHTAGKPSL